MAWHPGLDDIEASAAESDMRDRRAWQSRQRDNREPSTRLAALGSLGCWCGGPHGHDWPGKAGGAPHPRAAPGLRAVRAPGAAA